MFFAQNLRLTTNLAQKPTAGLLLLPVPSAAFHYTQPDKEVIVHSCRKVYHSLSQTNNIPRWSVGWTVPFWLLWLHCVPLQRCKRAGNGMLAECHFPAIETTLEATRCSELTHPPGAVAHDKPRAKRKGRNIRTSGRQAGTWQGCHCIQRPASARAHIRGCHRRFR